MIFFLMFNEYIKIYWLILFLIINYETLRCTRTNNLRHCNILFLLMCTSTHHDQKKTNQYMCLCVCVRIHNEMKKNSKNKKNKNNRLIANK